jgi:hypothetical protein
MLSLASDVAHEDDWLKQVSLVGAVFHVCIFDAVFARLSQPSYSTPKKVSHQVHCSANNRPGERVKKVLTVFREGQLNLLIIEEELQSSIVMLTTEFLEQ